MEEFEKTKVFGSIKGKSNFLNLIKDILINTGMYESESDYDWEPNWSKISQNSGLHYITKPGAKVKIYWKDEFELEPDIGYIFTLPLYDSDDIWMSGIVHIPKPNGCEKCDCDPEWHLLSKLTTNEMVKEIIIDNL